METPIWKSVLETEFNLRKSRNTRYSLRAYARDLGVSQSLLLYIFSGRRRLTADKAFIIANKLNLELQNKLAFIESAVMQ